MSRARAAFSHLTLLVGLGLIGDAGCTQGGGPGPGEVRVAFVLPDGATITTVGYQVLSSTGATLAGPGTFDVSDPRATITLGIVVPATPAGDPGDTVKLSATTSDGTACTGTSGAFAVPAGGSVTVPVTLVCGAGTPPGSTGSLGVTATLAEGDHCPNITAVAAAPVETSVGGTVAVSATASDADPGETLSYAWSPAGNLAAPTAPSTTYTCNATGKQTITLTVTDSHTPSCATTATLTVKCDAIEVCGNGIVGAGEQCDPPNGTTCNAACQIVTPPSVCGNKVVEAGESCDPPNGTTCDPHCQIIASPLCTNCELAGTVAGNCFNTSVPGQGATNATFGCSGFANATDQQNCIALVDCLRGVACQNEIHSAGSEYQEVLTVPQPFDAPVPCLCGNLPFQTCLLMTGGWPGACAPEYEAAAKWDFVGVLSAFFDPTTPMGVANNLMTCDIDNLCSLECGIGQ